MRIDAHSHGIHANRGPDGIPVAPVLCGWTDGPKKTPETPQEHVARSRELGVEGVVLLDPADVAFALKEIFGDYVIPVPMVDMDKISADEIDRLISRGAAGIKFIGPMHSYGDNRYFPLYDVVRSRKALAVFHTGFLSTRLHHPGRLLGGEDYVDITNMRPAAIDRIARAFPEMKILMSHFGNPWWEEAWNLVHGFKNVHADLSGGTAYRRPMEMWKMIFTHGGRPDIDTISRLCFGCDGSVCFQGVYQFAPFIEFHERFFEMMGVPADVREQINRGNIQRLTLLR